MGVAAAVTADGAFTIVAAGAGGAVVGAVAVASTAAIAATAGAASTVIPWALPGFQMMVPGSSVYKAKGY